MPLSKLTREELVSPTKAAGYGPYVEFLENLRVGQGGQATVEEEGVIKQTIKNRLNKSAEALGYEIQYKRTPPDEVVFQLISKG